MNKFVLIGNVRSSFKPLNFYHGYDDSQFQCVLFFHDKWDWRKHVRQLDCHKIGAKIEEQLEDEEHEDREAKRHLTQSESQSAFKWKVKGS